MSRSFIFKLSKVKVAHMGNGCMPEVGLGTYLKDLTLSEDMKK